MSSIFDGDDATQGKKDDAAATDSTSSWSMVALLKGLYARLGATVLAAGTAIIGKVGIDQTTPGTTDSVSVKSNGYVASVSITRPADTTAYNAGDVVGATAAVWTFPLIGASGGQIIIMGVDCRIDVAAIPSGMNSFRLHLYDATPPSALADNAVWDLPAGDRASYLGYLDVGSPVDVGSTLFVQSDQINKKVKLNASTSLFGYLVTNGGYTPALSTVKTIRLHTLGA